MSERLDRIGRQLEAIEEAIEAARAEPDPEKRERWLKVVGRATEAVRAEYAEAIEEEKRRPVFRIVKGGAVIAAMAALADWLRNNLRTHPHAGTAALVAAAAALTVVLVYQGLHHGTEAPPLSSGPSVSASQPASPGPSAPATPTPTGGSPHPPPPAGGTTSPPPRMSAPPSGVSVPPLMMVDATGTTGAPASSAELSPPPTHSASAPATTPPTVGPPSGPTTASASPSASSRPARRCMDLDLRPVLGASLCL